MRFNKDAKTKNKTGFENLFRKKKNKKKERVRERKKRSERGGSQEAITEGAG